MAVPDIDFKSAQVVMTRVIDNTAVLTDIVYPAKGVELKIALPSGGGGSSVQRSFVSVS